MNVVDYGILLLMAVSIVAGIYNGFVVSAMNAVSSIASWLIALIFYPLVSNALIKRFDGLFMRLVFYADGSSKIPSVEDRTARLASFSSEQIGRLLQEIQMPNPFSRVLTANVFNPHQQVQTLGEYFDYTIASVVVNILSFLLLFFLLKVLFTVAVSLIKAIMDLPVLRQLDSTFGGAFGLLRGMFMIYFLFALIPIVLTLAPADILTGYLENSRFAALFYRFNLFTSFVRGRL